MAPTLAPAAACAAAFLLKEDRLSTYSLVAPSPVEYVELLCPLARTRLAYALAADLPISGFLMLYRRCCSHEVCRFLSLLHEFPNDDTKRWDRKTKKSRVIDFAAVGHQWQSNICHLHLLYPQEPCFSFSSLARKMGFRPLCARRRYTGNAGLCLRLLSLFSRKTSLSEPSLTPSRSTFHSPRDSAFLFAVASLQTCLTLCSQLTRI